MQNSETIRIPGNRTLILKKSNSWDDSYLQSVILPFLNDGIPVHAKNVSSSHNSECWIVKAEGKQLFIKFFKSRFLRDYLSFIGKSRAERAWERGFQLHVLGFPTPLLIVQGNVVSNFRREYNFLITEALSDYLNTYAFINSEFPLTGTRDLIRKKHLFIKAYGSFIGKLHKAHIVHGDLRAGNILVKYSGDRTCFQIIDNERNMYFSKSIPDRLRLKNLVQMNMLFMPQITFTDRLRFFKSYLQENPDLIPSEKSWIRKIFIETRRRLQNIIPGTWE
jgi:hypothetical protein